MKHSTLLHLRIPFSLYLMPFFCFAASQVQDLDWTNCVVAFLAVHLFFYPASNAYNSYFDRDEESIGGLKAPPPVEKELYWYSLAFDAIALMLAFLININFALMLLVIGLVSKAYSHPRIRLKKYPVTGLLVVVFFQGAFTYCMTLVALENISVISLLRTEILFPAGLCSLLLLGSYPMTQVYQHGEDSKRGDNTMSRLLGIKGTFYWTMGIFTAGTSLFVLYLLRYKSLSAAVLFPVILAPTLLYFLWWFLKVLKDDKAADFRSTMRLNLLSSLCFITFFILLGFL